MAETGEGLSYLTLTILTLGAPMLDPVAVSDHEQQLRFCELPGLSVLTPDVVARHRPQVSLLFLNGVGKVEGRCSLWWQDTPAYAGHRLGLIGHFAVRDAESASYVLATACEQLAQHSRTLAVGPMDGNTWNRYRLLTQRGTEPPFFLEPDNPDDWPDFFIEQGFRPLAEYYSAITHSDALVRPISGDVLDPAPPRGIAIRSLDLTRFDEELGRIHTLTLDSFRDNFLYTPIDLELFLSQYQGIRPHVRPELVLQAEHREKLIGYLFGIPDLMQAKRGQPIDTAIAKTMAVHPDHRGAGLGSLLLDSFARRAAGLGYRRVIHALMHEDNKSRRISAHSATTIRRYTLYAKPLGGPA
jgi:GNAT superfamily N-acetyltransferase